MNTEEIMHVALSKAGMKEIPADSGIHVSGKNLRKVLFSLDVTNSELLLAKSLGCDLVIAHHPLGDASINFPKVLWRHLDFLLEHGVPKPVAEEAVKQLVERIEVRGHPANYLHVVSAARAMGMPLMNIHLPLDQIGRQVLLDTVKKARIRTVKDLIQSFEAIPEFANASTRIALRMGSEQNEPGKIALVFAAGTNGGYPVAKAYFDHGIDTVIYLHIDYDELRRLRENSRGNLIVLGHIAGDSIGINMFLRELRNNGLEVVTVGIIEPGILNFS